ncbi:hypothetical protein V6N11_026735 [Hibiscus sabdariffa]|uniref:Leucine-rich repeat-containing N-terminal plant-type domain-containing protein n=1 Tax=Hibiscus sabdariffa TaxID=183260 RepID=A0ABR2SWW5_9ROSI
MYKELLCLYFTVVVFSATLFPESKATTDKLDVIALNGLFKALNTSSQLKGWMLDGGDPCGDVWTGVACSGSSVTHLCIFRVRVPGLKMMGHFALLLLLAFASFQILCFASDDDTVFYESFDEPFDGRWIVSVKDDYKGFSGLKVKNSLRDDRRYKCVKQEERDGLKEKT